MTDNAVYIISQKLITKERARLLGLTSEEVFKGMRYVLYNIFMLTEEEIPKIFSIDFLKKYDLYRYYCLIEVPPIYSKVKQKYILSKLCPNVVEFDYDEEVWQRYLLNLGNDSDETFWTEFHDTSLMLKIIRRLLTTVFSVDLKEDLFDFSIEHPEVFEKVLKLFKVYDFYEDFCFCYADLIWFSFDDTEQKTYFLPYMKARLKEPLGQDLVESFLEESETDLKAIF